MTKQPPLSSLFPFLLLLLVPISVISQSLDSERAILLSIKQQWGDLQAMSSWDPTASPCTWTGIQCFVAANAVRVVTGILLSNASINTQIPASICELKNLTVLDLSWNYIPDGFPTVLYNCSSLTHIDLSMNTFVGPIPGDIDRLSDSLQYLDLSSNNFTGDVPRSIGRLKELRTLYLTYNLLNGTFPVEIANLSKLEDLRMAWNPFTPMALPSDWGKLKNLKYLFMTGCNLVGEIPESFGAMESLEHLDFAWNQLVGKIPNMLFLLKDLSYLYLYKNKLSGEIPNLVLSLNLREIDLSQNKLTGSIPQDFGKLESLQVLNLFNNKLTGEIPSSIGLLPELATVKLFYNNISGTLPPELGLHSRLEGLEIGGNKISGPLPENLCSKGALAGITAFSNKLSGEIPKSLENCSTLFTLMLQDNNFTGNIPSGIWNSPNLYSLMFSNNGFTGQLPDQVASNMTRIQIDNNKFSGSLPDSISTWKNLQVLDAGNNSLSGSLPLGLTSLTRLASLSLEGNQLSGELPIKISSWKNLCKLNLSRNMFSGPIPPAFGSLSTLNYLDLSGNELSGEIPTQLKHVPFSFLNLSNNKLSGEIPTFLDNGAFANSFLNTSLCASDTSQIVAIPKCSAYLRSSSSSKHLSHEYLVVILVLAVLLFLVTLYFTLCAIKEMRQRKHNSELTSWNLTPFQLLDFNEGNIISSLSEHSVIGSGGSGKVYLVQLDSSGYSVAVKKIWNNKKIDNAQFLAEVQILGTIRHNNIVKLLCCISKDNSKLLVYEYLENQSLDRWLFGRRKLQSEGGGFLHVLDWPTRLRIAIGAAQGLCYMHHDCDPPIIHRDIKSSNILLDSEFNAKIADFGLAKIVKQGELHTMSNIAGSFGYFAPEYQYTTKVNEKIDVYSFGVVLLELTTGKEPKCGDEILNLAEWSWKHYSEEKPIEDALDEEIKQPCYIGEMIGVFNLGIHCTSPLPNSRPSMKEVLEVLRRCRSFEDDARMMKVVRKERDVAPLLGSSNNKNGSRKVVQDAMEMV